MTSDKIGRYEIVHEIARGGMAIVYLAKDTYMQRLVAVKVLPRVFMHDPQFEKRFTREARVVASLEHPAIVPVYDFGYHGEQPFMVYRFMSGGTLKNKIQNEGAKSLTDTAKLLSRLAPAIDKAHDKGIIHRDLKPSNILFDDDDKAYIADFGIAKIVESTSHLTGNAIVGTPAYMSPEQFTGDSEVGRYSDIYALGIILYELLSGELPFKADTTPRLMKLHIMDPVPSIREIRSELPQDIDAILGKALAKGTENRYQRVEELRKSFERIISIIPSIHDVPEDLDVDDEDATVREPAHVLEQGEMTVEPVEQKVDEIKVEDVIAPRIGTPSEEELEISVQAISASVTSRMQTALQTGIDTALHGLKTLTKNKELLAVLLISAGLSVGNAIGAYIMSTDQLFLLGTLFMVVGAAGGISIGLTAKWMVKSLPWLRTVIIAVVWFGSWAGIWPIGEALGLRPLWDLDYITLQALLTGVAGLLTGLCLFWDDSRIRWRRSIVVFLGWGAAAAIGVMFLAQMSVKAWLRNYFILDKAITLDGFLSFFIIGAIGGSITFWQLKKSMQVTDSQAEMDFSDTLFYFLRNDWIVILLLLIGWPIAEVLAQVTADLMEGDTSLIYLIIGAVGAIFTGLTIRKLKPSFRWIHILIIATAWMLLWEGRWNLANLFDVEPGLNGGWYLIRLITAGVAGVVTGMVLRNAVPILSWRSVFRISVSWVFGWGIASAIAGYFIASSDWIIYWDTPIAKFSYFRILVLPLVGLSSGVTTLREIINAERTESTLDRHNL